MYWIFQPRPQEKLSRLYLFYGASKTLAVLHGRSKKQTNVYCLWNHTSKFCLICQKCVGNTFFPHLFKDHNLDCLSRSFPLKSWRKIFLSLQETTNGTDGKKLFILKAHSELSPTLSFTPQLWTKGFKLSSANPTATRKPWGGRGDPVQHCDPGLHSPEQGQACNTLLRISPDGLLSILWCLSWTFMWLGSTQAFSPI